MWAVDGLDKLSSVTRDALEDPENEVFFSAASIWEIAIKAALRREDFIAQPEIVARAALRTGFTALPIGWETASTVLYLAPHHKDPFDRLLVAQAIALPARLLTADSILARYTELAWVCAS